MQPGQGIVVDLLLQDVTRQVQVTVTSANGTDLTGALVSLTSATLTGPAAQPVVRTGAGASTYTTTFNQVPTGDVDRHGLRPVRAPRHAHRRRSTSPRPAPAWCPPR